jgi:hypothetical protein
LEEFTAMILYKKGFSEGKKERSKKEVDVRIEELPKRPIPKYITPRDREKFIKTCETVIRKSTEYKDYIRFLKNNLNMNECIILSNLKNGNGKRYHIEIHHEPFTLFDIVETVISKRLEFGESINALNVADEVMDLHYSGIVGLVPLTITMHELVHNGRIFIPLQYIYHKYNEFFKEYEKYMNPSLIEKIEAKVNLSLQTQDLVSDSLDVEFVYLNVDGFDFPEIPEEWKNAIFTVSDEDKQSDEK